MIMDHVSNIVLPGLLLKFVGVGEQDAECSSNLGERRNRFMDVLCTLLREGIRAPFYWGTFSGRAAARRMN